MPWHVTPNSTVAAILKDGLMPAIGPRSALIGEAKPLVHLFSSFADLESGDWLLEHFDEDERLSLFHVARPAGDGAWTEVGEPVGPELLTLVAIDMDDLDGDAFRALHALDKVPDPLADLESFRTTRCAMSARAFGSLVGDMTWSEDTVSEVLVYAAAFWIEALPDGRHMLTIGNRGMITGAGHDLGDLEAALFDYARSEARPTLSDEEGTAPGP